MSPVRCVVPVDLGRPGQTDKALRLASLLDSGRALGLPVVVLQKFLVVPFDVRLRIGYSSCLVLFFRRCP